MSVKLLKTLVFSLCAFSLSAAEVDSFTRREVPLEDSLALLNKKTNDYLKEALERANRKRQTCSEKHLYRSMRKYFNNQYRGDLGKYIVDAEDFDKNLVTIEDSIYQDFKWHQAFVPGFWGRVVVDPSAANINVGGVIVGTDKFEHFMGSGYFYFRKNYIKGEGVRAAMDIGYSAETGFMGAVTTGVKSYGDLSANFNGMRFWNHVLQKYDDVLGQEFNIGPYVVCDQDKWVQVKDIDWSQYVDHTFDEGLNCSAFPDQEMTNMVYRRIADLERKSGKNLDCPVSPAKIRNLIPKYKEFANELINASGHYALDIGDE